jgi:hypothetical protein
MSPPPRPWDLTRPTRAQVLALQAVYAGVANPEQQRLAIAFIVKRVAAADRETFWPGADGEHAYDGRRATDFAEGRRWVGIELRRLIKSGAPRARLMEVDIDEPPDQPAQHTQGDPC